MIAALPIVDVLLKYGIYILGPGLIIIGAFLFGIRHANKNAELERLDSEKKLRQDIYKAEQANQSVEEKRNEDIESVRNAGTIDQLIKLWKKSNWSSKS